MTLDKFKARRAALCRNYGDRLLSEDLYGNDAAFRKEVDALSKFAKVNKTRIISSLLSNPV